MGIPPLFRAALPTQLSLRSPTQTLLMQGYSHGYSGSKSPENKTQLKQSNVCFLVVTHKQELHTRVKPYDLQTLPRLCFESDREKTSEADFMLSLDVYSWHLSDSFLFLICPEGHICSVGTVMARFRLRARIRF